MKIKLPLISSLLIICFSLTGQNLVVDPSFEAQLPDYNCDEISPMLNYRLGLSVWDRPNLATPDYYNNCHDPALPGGHPENGFFGGSNQPPRTGNGVVAITLSNRTNLEHRTYSEILQGELSTNLTSGRCYEISFYIKMGSLEDCGIERGGSNGPFAGSRQINLAAEKIGVGFSTRRLTPIDTDYETDFLFPASVETAPGIFITEINDWQKVTFFYTALGTERVIHLGFFNPTNSSYNFLETEPRRACPLSEFADSASNLSAYYFIDDVFVGLASPPQTFSIDATTKLCQNDTIRLFGIGPTTASYFWTGPNGFRSILQNPIIPNAQVNMSGVYTLEVMQGCSDVETKTINVNINPLPILNIFGPNTVCENTQFRLEATNNSTYEYIWSTSSDSLSTVITASSSDTTVFLSVVDSNGCVSKSSIDLSIKKSPLVEILNLDTINLCPGECFEGIAFTEEKDTIPDPKTFTKIENSPIPRSFNNPLVSDLSVGGLTYNTTDINSIEKVCLTIEHDDIDDMYIRLLCPDGRVMALFETVQGTGLNMTQTCFSPTATLPMNSSTAPYTGTFTANQSFNRLNNCSSNGIWQLQLGDYIDNNISGNLIEWSITFNDKKGITRPVSNVVWEPMAIANLSTNDTAQICPIASDYVYFTATGDNACVATDSLFANLSPPFDFTTIVNNAACGNNLGSINVSSATSGLSYNWTDGFVGNNRNNLSPGDYTIIISNGVCTIDTSFTIVDENTLEASVSSDQSICQGESVNLTATGGDTYAWSPGAGLSSTTGANVTASPSSTTTYSVEVSLGTCTDVLQVTVEVLPRPNIMLSASEDSLCSGESTTLTASGGDTFAWNPAAGLSSTTGATVTATPSTTTTYTVLATSANGCTSSQSITVIVNPAITDVDVTETNLDCGIEFGSIGVNNVIGGTAPFSYSLNGTNFQSGILLDSLSAGSYTLIVRDVFGCTFNHNFTLTQTPGIDSADIIISNASCGTATGSININAVFGGVSPYQYAFNGSVFTSNTLYENLNAGSYAISIRDANDCILDTIIQITSLSGPSNFDLVATPSACGNSDGSVTVSNVIGGLAPYEYSIDGTNYQSSATFNNLDPGTYSIFVRDAMGCILSKTITVQALSGISNVEYNIINEACAMQNGSIEITNIVGGTSPYTYSIDGVNFQSATLFQNLSAGTYTITIEDDASCIYTETISITELTAPTAIEIDVINTSCINNSDGEAEVLGMGNGNITYLWNTTPVQTTARATGLSAGTYTCTVGDSNLCTVDIVVSITEPDALQNSISATESACTSPTGTATASVSGGTAPYQYTWNTTPIQTTATAINLEGGQSFTVTVIDANGCSVQGSISITQTNPPNISLSSTESACTSPTGTATASVSGGTAPYQYAWNTTPIQTTATAINLEGGQNFTVTVIDANGCSVQGNINIQVLNGPSLSIIDKQNTSCANGNDGYLQALASGGTLPYLYSWNTTPEQTTDFALDLTEGNYTLTLTDASGCMAIISDSIFSPEAIQATFSTTNDACGQGIGSIIASATGGTGNLTYQWTDDSGNIISTNSQLNNLSSGTYTLLINDANGCTQSFTQTIDEDAATRISGVAIQNVSCEGGNDGSATAMATSSSTPSFSWNTNPIQTTATATNLSAGTYTVTVSNANGCSHDTSITIGFNNPLPVFDLGVDTAFCQGEAVNIGTNAMADGYSWSTGEISDSIFVSDPGKYLLTINRNGCFFTDSLMVREDVVPPLELGPDSTFCGDVFITINIGVGGNAAYVWNDGSTSPNRTITLPDSYWAQISRNTCIVSDTVAFFSQPELEITLPDSVELCQGDVYNISPALSNQENPIYNWSTGEITPTISVDSSGKYFIEISDGMCVKNDSIVVNFLTIPTVNLGADTNICDGESITLDLGNSPYNIIWNTGNTSATQSTDSAGVYWAELSNKFCVSRDSIVIDVTPLPVFNIGNDSSICFGDAISIGAELDNATYLWNTGAQSPFISPSQSGNYSLSVTVDACSNIDDIIITVNSLPIIDIKDAIICQYDSIVLDASCQNCTSYLWENGETVATQTVFSDAIKEVSVTNINRCTASERVEISLDNGVNCEPVIYVPNAFTPDGDGINDLFFPVFREDILESFQLSIFNRWGEKIFTSNNLKNTWDGTYKNTLVQIGIYNYSITYKLINNVEIKQINGHVNVIK